MNDSSLTAEEKAKMLARIDLTKLERHTPIDEARKTVDEIRDMEVTNAFATRDDSILGLEQVEGAPGDYMFGVINVLDKLGMLRDNADPREHHRIKFDNQKGVIEVMQLWLKDVPDAPAVTNYLYSKDPLRLPTQNRTHATDTAKKQCMNILDKCLEDLFDRVKGYSLTKHEKYIDSLERVKGNQRFEKWISLKHNLPLRIQPRRGHVDEEADEGSGMQKIFISPKSSDRIKRAFVLHGERKSSMEDNPDASAEFTGIPDSLMSDGKLPVRAYKILTKKWSSH